MAIETGNVVLDQFTTELDQIVRRNTNGTADGAAIVQEVMPAFRELIADMSWLDEKVINAHGERTKSFMLAKAPDNAWTVVSTSFGPGYSTGVHDHLVWGLIGVWRGVEYEHRFHRLDDGSRPGYAEMKKIDENHNQPGDISILVPPVDDYHSIENTTDETSFSIHIYGGSLDGILRNQYDLETGEIRGFRSRYGIIC
jgi:3-mercaptopropionate dioxygenase